MYNMGKVVVILFGLTIFIAPLESFNQNYSFALLETGRNNLCSKKLNLTETHSLHHWNKAIFGENSYFRNDINTKLRFESETYLRKFSFLYGLTVISVDDYLYSLKILNVNPKCLYDMKMIKNGIDNNEIWAKKLLDSSGTYSSGFILGNNYWMGSKKGCDSINQKLKLTLSKRFDRIMIENLLDASSPIDVNFRMLHAKHNSPWQLEMKLLGEGILHLGLCVPHSCSNSEIGNLSQYMFNQKTLQPQSIYELQPDIITIRDLQLSAGYFNKFTVKLFILLFVATITLSICATSSNETNPKTLYDRVVKCFSVQENFAYLTKTDTTPSTIPVINGLRSVACFWIITPHINWFMHYTLDNEAVYYDYAEKSLYQPITNAPILVDLFFTISGFLLAANFLKNRTMISTIRENTFLKNIKLFGRLLLKRYMRLSPPYYIMILIVEILTTLLADVSHFYIYERNDLLFEKYWWRNLLYIQNLYNANEMMGCWTWYLACEMQYFVLFTILLFVYAKNKELGKQLFVLVWFIMFMTSFGSALYQNYNAAFDVWYETRSVLYMGPFARIHPYNIGMLSAYVLNSGQIGINKKYLPVIWIGAASIILLCLFSSLIRNLHFVLGSLVLIAQRLTFGVAVAWVIIASLTGNGNWLTKFLEHRCFVHINKISYAIYLLNPIIITMIYGLRDSPSHTDVITTTAMTAAIGFIAYIIGVLFALLCDVPYSRLTDEFIKIDRKKLAAKDI